MGKCCKILLEARQEGIQGTEAMRHKSTKWIQIWQFGNLIIWQLKGKRQEAIGKEARGNTDWTIWQC